MGLLDRYLLRLIAPAALLGSGVFLFALLLNELVVHIQLLLSQGANAAAVGLALAYLVPGVFAVVVPSSVLLGVLFALNGLSGSRELIAMRAAGISPWRLLPPVGTASLLAFGFCAYLMLEVVPESNRRFLAVSAELIGARLRTEIEPRVFYDELLDGRVLLVQETPAGDEGWRRVFLAETGDRREPTIFLAERGRLVANPEERVAFLELNAVEVHDADLEDPGRYRIQRAGDIRLPLSPTTIFGPETTNPHRSTRAMKLPELVTNWEATGHPAFRVEIHKKFALPAACLAFGLIGLALGLRPSPNPARTGAFALAILVILGYYFPLSSGEEMALAGTVPPWLGIWAPNIMTVVAGLVVLLLASRELDPLAPLARLAVRTRARLGNLLARRHRTRGRRRLPGLPTILDRYLVSQLLGFALLALLGLLAVQTIGRLAAVIGDAVDQGMAGTPLVRYLWVSLPGFADEMLPLATLAGTLVAFGFLGRNSEVTAFLAGGVSLTRLTLPALAVGLIAGAAGHGIQEALLPASGPETEDLGARIRGAQRRTVNPLQQHWRLGPEGRIYHYEQFDPDNLVLTGLSVFGLDGGASRLVRRSYASSAHWSGESWVGLGGWERDFSSGDGARSFAIRQVPGVAAPDAFLGAELVPALPRLARSPAPDRIRRQSRPRPPRTRGTVRDPGFPTVRSADHGADCPAVRVPPGQSGRHGERGDCDRHRHSLPVRHQFLRVPRAGGTAAPDTRGLGTQPLLRVGFVLPPAAFE